MIDYLNEQIYNESEAPPELSSEVCGSISPIIHSVSENAYTMRPCIQGTEYKKFLGSISHNNNSRLQAIG